MIIVAVAGKARVDLGRVGPVESKSIEPAVAVNDEEFAVRRPVRRLDEPLRLPHDARLSTCDIEDLDRATHG
ncbi:hypothetical protein USDA257_c41200 [Sinorhizobium fredii USDA 257]|uniref:Uncharacterized protein n=1 Tax=Sinorhizobium fredii (strain USDA 257) TaxID=1185652 RepID=I3X9V5_SINF2|nr:hypothetical protein USDA257_c41200 [Sinorhizobium fredii USDA 257]